MKSLSLLLTVFAAAVTVAADPLPCTSSVSIPPVPLPSPLERCTRACFPRKTQCEGENWVFTLFLYSILCTLEILYVLYSMPGLDTLCSMLGYMWSGRRDRLTDKHSTRSAWAGAGLVARRFSSKTKINGTGLVVVGSFSRRGIVRSQWDRSV